jgi:hypothetical protein
MHPALTLLVASLLPAELPKQPVYLWHEPEWFEGVEGSFAYWTGSAKPTGSWGIAGPGISAEWTQGGESEWNSIGAAADETKARCGREILIPRAGRYHVHVRLVEHRRKKAPFRVVISQAGKVLVNEALGVRPVLPANDEYLLYWGFSFAWSSFAASLPAGPVRLELVIDEKGEAWRQVDALLLTDDDDFVPHGREKPPFAYLSSAALHPAQGWKWRGAGLPTTAAARPALAGRDFSMWTGVDGTPKWWSEPGRKLDTLTLPEVFYQHATPPDIRTAFHKQYPRPSDSALLSWPGLLPGFYLGQSPDLGPDSPLRRWLTRTRTPFYILTNYASGNYTEKTGPATYEALSGPLKEQFLGYIHGEAIGTGGVGFPDKPLGRTRREQVDGLARHLRATQAKQWSGIYKTKVGEEHWDKGIPCLSVDSTALAHLFHAMGSRVVGYEEDSTNFHVPMRIAFQRGAARQYGGAWLEYASGNFGDACNYFTQEPRVPRGAKGWWHSKYAVTDGVTACWYRKMYYLNYLSGASAIFWEQGLENQWILPGPGTHPIQLSPFGRGTEDFQGFVSRLPDRGEPLTPIAFLLNRGHGYEPVNYRCRMLHHFPQNKADRELRELFNVAWLPAAVVEGRPAAPDVQSLPSGVYGNIFDVLVDDPKASKAISGYPIVWLAGDVEPVGEWSKALQEHVRQGGTLVLNSEHLRYFGQAFLGLQPAGGTAVAEQWKPEGGVTRQAVPFDLTEVKRAGAAVLAWAGERPLITRQEVGKGVVIVYLVPGMIGQDERAHPALPWLMNGLTQKLLPVEVRRPDGSPVGGEILYQVNRTRTGYLVLLMNNQGVDKTPSGVARVDRRRFVDVLVRTEQPVREAREWTGPRELGVKKDKGSTIIPIRVHPGDVQVVGLVVER